MIFKILIGIGIYLVCLAVVLMFMAGARIASGRDRIPGKDIQA